MKPQTLITCTLLWTGSLLGTGLPLATSAAPAKARVNWSAILGGKRADTEAALGKPVKTGVSSGADPLEWTQYRLSGTKGLRQFWTAQGQLVETHVILGKDADWQTGVKALGFNPAGMKLTPSSPEEQAKGSGQIVRDPIKLFNLHYKSAQDAGERFDPDIREFPVLWFEARSINDKSPD